MLQRRRDSEDQRIASPGVSNLRQNSLGAPFPQHEQSATKKIAAEIQAHPYLSRLIAVIVPAIVVARFRDHAIDPSSEPSEAFATGNLFYDRTKFGEVRCEMKKTERGEIIGDVFLTDLTVRHRFPLAVVQACLDKVQYRWFQ